MATAEGDVRFVCPFCGLAAQYVTSAGRSCGNPPCVAAYEGGKRDGKAEAFEEAALLAEADRSAYGLRVADAIRARAAALREGGE